MIAAYASRVIGLGCMRLSTEATRDDELSLEVLRAALDEGIASRCPGSRSPSRVHDVDLTRSVHVGHGPADRGFALRAGVSYFDVGDGWPDVRDA